MNTGPNLSVIVIIFADEKSDFICASFRLKNSRELYRRGVGQGAKGEI
jgi:hypothetical protein